MQTDTGIEIITKIGNFCSETKASYVLSRQERAFLQLNSYSRSKLSNTSMYPRGVHSLLDISSAMCSFKECMNSKY